MNSTSSDIRSVASMRAISATYLALAFLLIGCFTKSQPNLLLNGDLSAGSNDVPEHWTMTFGAPPDSYKWSHAPGAASSLEIAVVKGYFLNSYWSQTVRLAQPGWYFLRAEVKTENPDTEAAIKIRGVHATAFLEESDREWTSLEVYFKIGYANEPVQIECGVRAEAIGRAFYRNFTLSRFPSPPPRGARQFDMTHPIVMQIPKTEAAALLGVKIARAPEDESLLRDVLNFRAVAVLLVILAALMYLDLRYAGASRRDSTEMRKAAGVGAVLLVMLLSTWLVTRIEYLPGHGFYVVEPRAIGGDEPHYVVMINSLLLKHDLQVQTAYNDVDMGGPEAGIMSRGVQLDRQTIVVNRRTGHRATGVIKGGLWYRNPGAEFEPSPDVYEIPVHPVGFPLLMALLLTPMEPRAGEVEPDVGFILMLIAWLGIVVTYLVGRQTGMGRGWALAGASLLFAASPWLAYSRSFFAESTIGLAIIFSLWALMADFPILATLAAAAGALMKGPFGLVGVGYLVEEVRERRWKDAMKIAIMLGLPAVAFVAYNLWRHQRALELGVGLSFSFRQLADTFVDPIEGLLLYAPWTIFGFVECGRAFVSRSASSRLARTMALPLFLYLVVVSSVGFGAGYSYGPRYWVAFLPWLALGTIEAMRPAGRWRRGVCAVLVLFGVAMGIAGALRYPHLFHRPALDGWRGFY